MKPIIGITSGVVPNPLKTWSPDTIGQSQTYMDAIIASGGIPIFLPLSTDTDVLRRVFDQIDGLLLAGGDDVNPALYGEKPSPDCGKFYDIRDSTEQQLIEWALAEGKPTLGICRGLQIINVSLGGSLYQHLPKDKPNSLNHNGSSDANNTTDLSHIVNIQSGSQLNHILGVTTVGTNTHHHQAVKTLGKGAVPTAHTEDKIIEAIELVGHPNVVAVQSHPESLTTVEPRWKLLFDDFVERCATSS